MQRNYQAGSGEQGIVAHLLQSFEVTMIIRQEFALRFPDSKCFIIGSSSFFFLCIVGHDMLCKAI